MNGPSHYQSAEACLLEADRADGAAATGYLLAAIAHAVLSDVGLQAQRLIAVTEISDATTDAWREALS
jgi:hypothetical protein